MSLEIINEIRIARSDKYNMYIGIYPTAGTNYFYDPYF